MTRRAAVILLAEARWLAALAVTALLLAANEAAAADSCTGRAVDPCSAWGAPRSLQSNEDQATCAAAAPGCSLVATDFSWTELMYMFSCVSGESLPTCGQLLRESDCGAQPGCSWGEGQAQQRAADGGLWDLGGAELDCEQRDSLWVSGRGCCLHQNDPQRWAQCFQQATAGEDADALELTSFSLHNTTPADLATNSGRYGAPRGGEPVQLEDGEVLEDGLGPLWSDTMGADACRESGVGLWATAACCLHQNNAERYALCTLILQAMAGGLNDAGDREDTLAYGDIPPNGGGPGMQGSMHETAMSITDAMDGGGTTAPGAGITASESSSYSSPHNASMGILG